MGKWRRQSWRGADGKVREGSVEREGPWKKERMGKTWSAGRRGEVGIDLKRWGLWTEKENVVLLMVCRSRK